MALLAGFARFSARLRESSFAVSRVAGSAHSAITTIVNMADFHGAIFTLNPNDPRLPQFVTNPGLIDPRALVRSETLIDPRVLANRR